ncbi:heparinase II/III domain-containing protein [Paenibacillus flagellatus]|uniref:Heparinase II/III-like C-terminal domain-containing protein n=1 Tax=Paenibacillus flagellatus TaxID=2211139 RepID=A0A2V5KC39_9BACL|nr:heparinase II/III family protein [Paenibacillus flagellatus]PYI57155.1 hypothetical protein DLM86_01565 [Paenibacillus flagellatus]
MIRRCIAAACACALVGSLFAATGAEAARDPGGAGDGGSGSGNRNAADIAAYADRWAVAPRTAQAPVTDGKLDEPVWRTAFHADGFVTMYDNRPAEADTDLYVLYDEGHLYIGMEGHNDLSGTAPETETVELLLSPGPSPDVYRLLVPLAQGGRPIKTDWGAGTKELEQAEVELVRGQGGVSWRLEAAVPLASLGVERINEGDAWSMNVVRYYGVNSKPFSSWAPIRQTYIVDQGGDTINLVAHALNQSRLAPLYFSRPPALPDKPGSRSEVWPIRDWRLTYRDFLSKELVMEANAIREGTEIGLYWISPDGLTTKLDDPAIERRAGETHLAFRHPKPLAKGWYRLVVGFRQAGGPYHYFELGFDREALIESGTALDPIPAEPGPKTRVERKPASAQVQSLIGLIPDKTGFIFTGLPENPDLRPYQLYNWSASDPGHIVSKTTGTVYPNEAYPETRKLTATNRLGETVEYPYYEDAEGKRYFFTAHVWYFQKDYALRETAKLAATDPLGAARLLNRWADAYAGYLPTNDYYWTNYPVVSGPPYHYWGGVWYRWYTGEMTNMSYLINAYRDVRHTNAFELLSEELGFDVERKIVDSMFKPSFDFVRSFPVLNHNMEYTTWLGLVRMAKASGQPSYMHEAVELMQDFAANNFLSDGFWKEVTLSYHNQSTNGLLQSMNEAKGWTDPAGYASARNGLRIDNLDMAGTYPALGNAQQMQHVVAYPNGSYVPVQDTWANEKTAQPRTDLGSYLLPGAGISRLTLGAGPTQQQMYLNFVPKYGHNHLDPLNMTLFAKGQELMPDIGYTHTFFRKWTNSTLAHNTVVVDGQDMRLNEDAKHGGNIDSFVAADSGVRIVKARQESAYPVTDEYSRESWLVGFGDAAAGSGDGYVVDVFRVSGGGRHEYTLGGDANRDGAFRTDLPTEPYGPYLLPEGTAVTMPESENDTGSAEGHYYGYLYVQDVKRAPIPDGRYTVTLDTYENGAEKAKLNIFGLTDGGDEELFIGKAPSLRATRLSGTSKDINTEAVKYWMPKLVVRRSGTDLNSTFVHVMEPYVGSGGAKIESVEKLVPDQAEPGDTALRIRYGSTTDIVLSASDAEHTMRVGDIELTGKHGWIRLENGKVTKMVLADGTLLRKGDKAVTGEGAAVGIVTDVLRKLEGDPVDALVTEAQVSPEAAGRNVVVTHPDGRTRGYAVEEIRREGGRTLIVLDRTDPGWDIAADGSSRMTSYPFLGWNGAHAFRIANVDGR